MSDGKECIVDNQWVVPYNPLLSRTFKAHINVEYCSSVKSIKYVYKYVNKGSDMAVFGLKNDANDEVTNYQLGRYISSNEVVWRLLNFPFHERHPAVVPLAVHLEHGQRVYFDPETSNPQQLLEAKATTLTAFFELCQNNDFAKTLLYPQVPKYFTWTNKSWKPRARGKPVEGFPQVKASDVLGRVYTVHPNNAECYYVRLLLHTVQGPTSYEDLKTYEGRICDTFREACNLQGLLEDDKNWHETLKEAALIASPQRMRDLFCILLTVCHVSNPKSLWEKYKKDLSEDILFQAKQLHPDAEYSDAIYNEALIKMEDKVLFIGGKELKQYGLTTPTRQESGISQEMLRETSYDKETLRLFLAENEPKLTADQCKIYQAILGALDLGGFFFLDAPGGTGKTFVTNFLLANVRSQGKIALAVASSGIASTLLAGGRTAHSTFKLPLDLVRNSTATCSISKGTAIAKVLEK